jgi:adenine phosphoribosyltransferase
VSEFFAAKLGAQVVELPIVEVAPDLGIALFITSDVGLSVVDAAGRALADALRPWEPDAVVTAATMGIPLAIAVAGALDFEHYTVLHKTPKIHLADGLTEPLSSITTEGSQMLRLDRARLPMLEGQRVAFVDDVISTGSSAAAALQLIRRAGAEVVALGAAFVEGTAWEETLGADAARTVSLGQLPVFRPGADGGWTADWSM